MIISPWAMLMTPIRPKVMARPKAATNSTALRLNPRKAVPNKVAKLDMLLDSI